jgi:hypothetical protein
VATVCRGLAVLIGEVVPVELADGSAPAERPVWSVVIVEVEEVGEPDLAFGEISSHSWAAIGPREVEKQCEMM